VRVTEGWPTRVFPSSASCPACRGGVGMRAVVRRRVASSLYLSATFAPARGAASVEFFLIWPAVEAWRWGRTMRRPLVLAEESGSLRRIGFLRRFPCDSLVLLPQSRAMRLAAPCSTTTRSRAPSSSA
jgi:hypothetical protein